MSRINLNEVVPFKAIHVGEVIKDELQARSMKQSELARLIGVQRPILNDVIKGKRSLTPQMAVLIEEALDVPAKMLMDIQVDYELDCARISERVIQQRQYLESWNILKELINVQSFKKKGVVKGNIVEDVRRLFEAFNVSNIEEFVANNSNRPQ